MLMLTVGNYYFSKRTVNWILNFILFLIVAIAWVYTIAAGRYASVRYLKQHW